MRKPPICVKCRLEMRVVQNDRPVKDPASEGLPSTYWFGDEWQCPQCGARIVAGFGQPVEEIPSLASDASVLEFRYEAPAAESHALPAGLHRMRHDCEDLFRRLLPEPGQAADAVSWAMTPCAVELPEMYVPEPPPAGVRNGHGDSEMDHPDAPEMQWYIARHPYQLLALPDETEVLCAWPGKARCDLFRFTVGEYRAAWEAAAKAAEEGGEA